MKRIAVFCLLLLSGYSLLAQDAKLRLASDVWPPFTDETGKKAFATDLVNEALSRTGMDWSTDIVSFEGVIPGIKEGKFDGSAALWKTKEREAFLLYSEPYLENRLILVGKKGSDVGAKQLRDLGGKRIAIVGGYAYGDEVDETTNVTFVSGESDQANLVTLLNEEADYMLVDALLIQYLLTYQRQDVEKYLEIGTTPLVVKPLYFAIRKDFPNAEDVMNRFNEKINEMMADLTYNRILQVNWIRTDVDGDGNTELVLAGNQAGSSAPVNHYDVLFQQNNTLQSSNNRYYIDGQVYEGWEAVPGKYKLKLDNQSVKTGFGLHFNF